MKWWTETYQEACVSLSAPEFHDHFERTISDQIGIIGCQSFERLDIYYDSADSVLQSVGATLCQTVKDATYLVTYRVGRPSHRFMRGVFTQFPYDCCFGNPLHAAGPALSRAIGLARQMRASVVATDFKPVRKIQTKRTEFTIGGDLGAHRSGSIFLDKRRISFVGSPGAVDGLEYFVITRRLADADPRVCRMLEEYRASLPGEVLLAMDVPF